MVRNNGKTADEGMIYDTQERAHVQEQKRPRPWCRSGERSCDRQQGQGERSWGEIKMRRSSRAEMQKEEGQRKKTGEGKPPRNSTKGANARVEWQCRIDRMAGRSRQRDIEGRKRLVLMEPRSDVAFSDKDDVCEGIDVEVLLEGMGSLTGKDIESISMALRGAQRILYVIGNGRAIMTPTGENNHG